MKTIFNTLATWLAVYSWLVLNDQSIKHVLIWLYSLAAVIFLLLYIAKLSVREDIEEDIKKHKEKCAPCFYLGFSSDLVLSFVFAYHGHYVVATLLLLAALLYSGSREKAEVKE